MRKMIKRKWEMHKKKLQHKLNKKIEKYANKEQLE